MDVNAKDIIKQKVTEADEQQPPRGPGGPGGPPRGGPRRPMMPRREGEDDISRMTGGGGPDMPKAQFNPKELSQVKDVMILILASLLRSDLDKEIGMALSSGTPLDEGQLRHILDEARNADIPDSLGPVMQKIHSQIGGG